jgi:DNA-binding PadR family transcriptional regulator
MLAYGARVEASSGVSSLRTSERRQLSVDAGNPYILEGEKTTCFEIMQDLGWNPPDVIVVPVGTGGHLSMTWRAMTQLRESGLIKELRSRLLGVQLGPAPLPSGIRAGSDLLTSEPPFTELEESEPFFRKEAARAVRESRGFGLTTTAEATVRAIGLLARCEGIFAEPASASVIAALESAAVSGLIRKDDVIVCVITGAGLKDTKAMSRLAKATKKVSVMGDYTVARIQVGETKLALLRSLAERPRYGYELWHILSVPRRITTASIYQHLGELEDLGLVRRAGVTTARGRERISYELTRKGTGFLGMAGELEREESGVVGGPQGGQSPTRASSESGHKQSEAVKKRGS